MEKFGATSTWAFGCGAIAARTRFSDDHAVEGLVHGTNLGETDFESHDRCFAERFLLGKAEDKTGAPHPCQVPTPPKTAEPR